MKLAFVSAPVGEWMVPQLRARYGEVPVHEAEVLVVLGGDGFMLNTAHACLNYDIPIFGINFGTLGFLMNHLSNEEILEQDLVERIAGAEPTTIHALEAHATDRNGELHHALAFNEVSLFRQSPQAVHLRVHVDGSVRLEQVVCDGILVATPAGSTAYNLSANGPIIPIEAQLTALTPINTFRPRRWRGALLHANAEIRLEVLNGDKRPVGMSADARDIHPVRCVDVAVSENVSLDLLFDPHHTMKERVLQEQFAM